MASRQPDRDPTSALRRAAAAAVGNALPGGWEPAAAGAPDRATAHISAHSTPPLHDETNPKPRPAGRPSPAPAAGRPLRPRQVMAARLLLEGLTMKEVARRLGVHPATLTRWSADGRFQAEVRRQADRATTKAHIPPQNPTLPPPAAGETNPPPTPTPAEWLLRAMGLDGPS